MSWCCCFLRQSSCTIQSSLRACPSVSPTTLASQNSSFSPSHPLFSPSTTLNVVCVPMDKQTWLALRFFLTGRHRGDGRSSFLSDSTGSRSAACQVEARTENNATDSSLNPYIP
uniref:Uncharacterized protein n=1 Tax=Grammatophora oceanica TaxID=210454 RepID=A0A7S1V9Y4_9STRA